jgi:hypothetical protein
LSSSEVKADPLISSPVTFVELLQLLHIWRVPAPRVLSFSPSERWRNAGFL